MKYKMTKREYFAFIVVTYSSIIFVLVWINNILISSPPSFDNIFHAFVTGIFVRAFLFTELWSQDIKRKAQTTGKFYKELTVLEIIVFISYLAIQFSLSHNSELPIIFSLVAILGITIVAKRFLFSQGSKWISEFILAYLPIASLLILVEENSIPENYVYPLFLGVMAITGLVYLFRSNSYVDYAFRAIYLLSVAEVVNFELFSRGTDYHQLMNSIIIAEAFILVIVVTLIYRLRNYSEEDIKDAT